MNDELLELYSDYQLSSFGQVTATGMSDLLDGAYSHDQVTRLLSTNEFTSKTLWGMVKSTVRQVEEDDAVLIFDDTIEEKPYTDESDLIAYHYDHTKNRTVKGINLLNCLYYSQGVSIPVSYKLITKPIPYCDLKTKKVRRMSETTKNEDFRELLQISYQNQLKFKYVLADSWFCSNENMVFIKHKCHKDFIMACKSNRLVSLSEDDKKHKKSQRVDTLEFQEGQSVKVWISGVDFELQLSKKVFKNKDGSTGELYLLCSDLSCDDEFIQAVYQKRWNVELFHKNLKSNAAITRSPAHTVKTQSNHQFLSIYSAFRLETLALKLKMNKFQLRAKLYIKALKTAFTELQTLKAVSA
ncbi:IS701 family transposase [Parashewanella spongiae]|nr:transposase [Parashewanella spongiae]